MGHAGRNVIASSSGPLQGRAAPQTPPGICHWCSGVIAFSWYCRGVYGRLRSVFSRPALPRIARVAFEHPSTLRWPGSFTRHHTGSTSSHPVLATAGCLISGGSNTRRITVLCICILVGTNRLGTGRCCTQCISQCRGWPPRTPPL